MELRLHVERDELRDGPYQPTSEPTRLAAPVDGGLDRAHFVDPVSVLVVVGVSVLAERIVNHWLNGREQGVQVDLTQDPPAVSALANVPRGHVVVIRADGVEALKLDYDNEENLADTLVAVLERVGQ